MALIKCPECGKEISDKAVSCPACGHQIISETVFENNMICEECNTTLNRNDEICPNCGCPVVHKEKDTLQKVEVASINIPQLSKKKRIVFISISVFIILAIIGSIFGVIIHRKYTTAKYSENLQVATSTILLGASTAEDAGGLIHDVWYNTIYEKSDSRTDKYTKEDYPFHTSFNDDFNTSLATLMKDDEFSSKLDSIKSNQKLVNSIMKDLVNPPDKYKEAYEKLQTLYNSYLELTNLAINPTGNLTSYTSNFNNADTSTLNAYNAMKIYLED